MTSMLKLITMAGLFIFSSCAIGDPDDDDQNPADGDPIHGSACSSDPLYTENVAQCPFGADDYQPRNNASANDSWPACISDDNIYHPINQSISTIARVQAYTDIATNLWVDDPRPTLQDFIDMRVRLEEEQGLASRVVRRYDNHYQPPATGKCEDSAAIAQENPDYCVGPAKLQPLLTTAFADGSLGKQRIVNAAKIHAALQWFLYVSVIKEVTTCATTPADCDSGWAYYSGGGTRDNPIGLSAEIKAWAPETHQRIYDGLLAVRCWRNLDNETGTASNLTLRDQAIRQLDGALLRGMAVLVRQRFAELKCTSDDYQQAALEALRILVPLLDRATRERDATAADLLAAEIAKEASSIDVAKATSTLDQVFECF